MKLIKDFFNNLISKYKPDPIVVARKKLAYYRSVIRYQFSLSGYKHACNVSEKLTEEYFQILRIDSPEVKNENLKLYVKKLKKEINATPYVN
ncbi:MAG: hypothetical protein K2X69_06030 [Silvanigrellaceae bacterium]|nr:hypothetical protein [Silvanigrellaceae bacterium]